MSSNVNLIDLDEEEITILLSECSSQASTFGSTISLNSISAASTTDGSSTKTSSTSTKHCKQHPEQYLYFYCHKCHAPVCRDCTVVTHSLLSGHTIVELQEHFKKYLDKFAEKAITYRESIRTLNTLGIKHARAIASTKDMQDRMVETVKNDLLRNIATLKQRASNLQDVIKSMCENQITRLEAQQSKLESHKSRMTAELESFNASISKCDTIEALASYREMKKAERFNKQIIEKGENIKTQTLTIAFNDDANFQKILQFRGEIKIS